MHLDFTIGLFYHRVIGWSLAERMEDSLVCNALDSAVSQRRPASRRIFDSLPFRQA
jgi:transposase InsO family protein